MIDTVVRRDSANHCKINSEDVRKMLTTYRIAAAALSNPIQTTTKIRHRPPRLDLPIRGMAWIGLSTREAEIFTILKQCA